MPERRVIPDSETIYIPSDVWTYVPTMGLDILQATGRVCSVVIVDDNMTVMDTAIYSIRTHHG